ncbi:hypothetical protein [Massiliimalia timonensis]|nr:hypothetical protein [Massiliimalia timonensis]
MKLSEKDVSQIVITDDNDEVLAVISDDEIIEKNGYKVVIEFLP